MKKTTIAATVLLAFAPAIAEETTIAVPQGSGVFPTVGQVDCLEEMGSGRFCAATYECADESGDLWDDLANHDGRRAIGVDSPVARQRGCTITVDGKAAVRWFTGFSPDGRDGALVGVTAKHDAATPVVRSVVQGDEHGPLLDWMIANDFFDPADIKRQKCDHIKDGTPELAECRRRATVHLLSLMGRAATPATQCIATYVKDELEHREVSQADLPSFVSRVFQRLLSANSYQEDFADFCGSSILCAMGSSCSSARGDDGEDDVAECCGLLNAEAERLSLLP